MRLQYAARPGDSSAYFDRRDATQVPSVDHAQLDGVATGDRASSQQQDFLAARGAAVARGNGKHAQPLAPVEPLFGRGAGEGLGVHICTGAGS